MFWKKRKEIENMKQGVKVMLTAIAGLMVFLPWTIFILRRNEWALQSPAAEIIIGSYAVFMIFSGVFTFAAYMKGKVQNNLMKVCLVINEIYAVFGVAALGMMAVGKVM